MRPFSRVPRSVRLIAAALLLGSPALAAPLGAQQRDSVAARDSAARDSAARDSAAGRLAPVVVRAAAVLPTALLQASAVSVAGARRVAEAPSRILPDVLRELPGVQVQQTNAGHGTIILRGLTGNQVLVLVDGVRLNNSTVRDGPSQYLATIDPERVERVEVVRGPGSVLYGSDAIGGVVNVITRRPAEQDGAAASLAHSTADGGARVAVSGSLAPGGGGAPRLRLRGGASASRIGELRAGRGVGRQPATDFESVAGDASAVASLGRCSQATAAVQGMRLTSVSRFDRLVDFRAPRPGPDAEFDFTPQTQLMGSAGYEAVGCPGAVSGGVVTVGTLLQQEGRRQRALVGGADGPPAPAPEREYVRDDVRTRFARAYVEPRLRPGATLRLGADAYRDGIASHGYREAVATGARTPLLRASGADSVPAGRFPNGARATAVGAYAHGSWVAAPRLRLLGGARWDDVRVALDAGDAFGGRVDSRNARLSTQLGVDATLAGAYAASAHVGQGFRAPNVYDLSTVSTVPGGIVLPSPALRPEYSVTWEASLRRGGERMRASATGYLTRVSGLVDRLPGSYRGDTLFEGQRVFRAANLGRGTVRGVELAAEGALAARLDVRAQAFLTRGTQRLPGAAAEPMTRVPPPAAALALRRALRGGERPWWVEAVARGALAQRRLSGRDLRDSRIEEGGTPAWATLGVRGGLPAGAAGLTLGLENLLDRAYREHGSGIDAPGRHLWVRVEVGRK